MEEFVDDDGNVWLAKVDAQGNPILSTAVPANQRGRVIDTRGPSARYEEPQAAANVNKTQTDIIDTREDNRRADKELSLRERELKIKEQAAEAERLERERKVSGRETGKTERAARIRTALDNIRKLREMVKSSDMSTGGIVGQETFRSGDDYMGASSFFNQQANDVAGAIQMVEGDLINQVRKEMEESGSPIGVKGADTEKEAGRLAASIANLAQTQDEEQFLIGLKRAEDYYSRRLEGLGEQGAEGSQPRKFSPAAGPQLGNAQGETYSTPEDLAVAEALQNVYNRGGSVRDMADAAQKMGYPVNLQNMQQWAEAIDYRDAKGKYQGMQTGYSTVQPPESGKRSLMGQLYGDFAGGDSFAGDLGTMAVSAGIGAGNAASFGGLDEITGGINSLVRGTSAEDEIAYANVGKQAAFDAAPGSALVGELGGGIGLGGYAARKFPNLAESLAGSGRRAAGTGAVLGGVTGGLESNNDRVGGAILGAGLGAGGGVLGQKVAGPGIEAIASSGPAQAISQKARAFANTIRPNSVQPSALPFTTPEQRVTSSMVGGDLAQVRSNLSDAESLGLPYGLADANPKLRSLAGSVSRKSQNARQMAEDVFDPRHSDQAYRANTAIEQNFATPVDPKIRGQELLDSGNLASRPFYNAANARGVPYNDEIASYLNTETGRKALKDARRIAENEGRNPDDLGFVMDEGGNVGISGFEQAGRFSAVPVGNPQSELRSGKVAGQSADVPTRGPLDLVGWLRQSGGLRDSGGELRHMGVTNQQRKGMRMVGQEARFGPLVSDDGMSLDDAAYAAWEAGYFPEFSERPSVNDFLDSFRDTYDGFNRRFLPDDQPEIDRYFAAEEQAARAREGRFDGTGLWTDDSTPAGMRPPLPDEAYGRMVRQPNFETLDYVKKGIQEQIYNPANTNPLTGELNKLSPNVRSLEQFRKGFVGALDKVNPDYPKARAAYAPYAKAKEALEIGMKGPGNRVKPRDVTRIIDGMPEQSLNEYRSGFATTLSDMADDTRLSGNPYERIYGSTSQREKIGQVFPDGAERFDRTYGLEKDMARTRYETLGGSPTASRMAADDQFSNRALEFGADAAADMAATGGALTLGNVLQMGGRNLRDVSRLGLGAQAERRADALAPILYNTDPAAAKKLLDQIEAYNTSRTARKATARRRGGLFGAAAPIAVIPPE